MIKHENYKSLVVVGSQWGDEGKGKITDFFAQSADAVVRFAGGDNAGHVIWIGGTKYKVTIVPSGILSPKVINVIGNGTVVNLEKLIAELKTLEDQGISTKNIFVSDRAQIILPFNTEIDELQEISRKEFKIGTTKKGIGPTYSDKANRIGLRICDLFSADFERKLEVAIEYHNNVIKNIYGAKPVEYKKILEDLNKQKDFIKDKIVDSGVYVDNLLNNKKTVLFEGAQGVMLDIDHGTYPFVTSSNTTANNVSIGVGIHNKKINKVVGVAKAYNTRVGAGPMPSEIEGETCNRIRETGHEYGSNTGRPRRIGWLDLVALKYAIRTGGIDEVFMTLMDVLDAEKEIKLCVGYELDGKTIQTVPALNEDYLRCKPVFETLEGWNCDTTKIRSYEELPEQAKNYLKRIQEFCEADILGFSVGPEREQTILMKGEFEW